MQKPSGRHKLTSDNNIIKFKKPVHDPFKCNLSLCKLEPQSLMGLTPMDIRVSKQ